MGIKIGEVSELGIESSRVSEFYRNHWKREIALSMPSFYQWQFTESPSDAGSDHCMVAADEDSDELYGVMGLNRRPFFLNGSKSKGAELTTWIVDEKHIGKGIGAKILKEIQNRYDILIGMGISDMALPIYMRSGFRYIKAIPRYVRVFDFDKIEDYAKCTPLAKKLAKQWLSIANQQFSISSLSREKVGLLEDVMSKRFNFFSRDYDHLQWRYSEHPIFEYSQHLIHANGNSKGKGCIVCMRVEKSVKGLNILHVLDCFGDPSDMQATISFINEFCLTNSIHLADFYCTSTSISKYFISSGWFSINDDGCFQFPHLFHPVKLRKPPTTSLIYWSKKDFVGMADIGKLYMTKEDADLDRPTTQTYQNLQKDNLKEKI